MTPLFFFVLTAAIGILAGFLGGLLGIGGGIIIVPALILLFDHFQLLPSGSASVIAVATSLSCIIFTSLGATIQQMRSDMVDWDIAKIFVIPTIVGGLICGFVAIQLSPAAFRIGIAIFLIVISSIMFSDWKPSPAHTLPSPIMASILGMLAGCISGLAGIGGGNIVVPILTYYNRSIHRAIATSSTLGIPIALAGTIGYFLAAKTKPILIPDANILGYVYIPAFVLIALGTFVAAPIGVKVAHRADPKKLRKAFSILLLIVGVRLFFASLSFNQALT